MFSVVKERPYSASSAFSASSSAASFTGVEVHVLALELGVSDDAAGEEACRQHRTCDRRNDFLLFHELCLSWLMMRVLSSTEREDRGWSMEKVRDRVVKGEMKYVLTGPNEAVFFERASDKEKFRHQRKRRVWKYERYERYLAELAGMPYWYDVLKEEELKRQEEAKRKEESSFVNVIGGFFSVIGAVLGFIFQVIVVICCIFLARNATQWFLGTGKYSKER